MTTTDTTTPQEPSPQPVPVSYVVEALREAVSKAGGVEAWRKQNAPTHFDYCLEDTIDGKRAMSDFIAGVLGFEVLKTYRRKEQGKQ